MARWASSTRQSATKAKSSPEAVDSEGLARSRIDPFAADMSLLAEKRMHVYMHGNLPVIAQPRVGELTP
jgi:hypothetical protein